MGIASNQFQPHLVREKKLIRGLGAMPILPTRGRRRRYAELDEFRDSLPRLMTKRPAYFDGIGIFRGKRGDIAWIKVRLPHGGTHKGRTLPPGASLEIKAGRLESFNWEQLTQLRNDLQGRADRGERLEDEQPILFRDWADDCLKRAKNRLRSYDTQEIIIRCHLRPFFGEKGLKQIAAQDVNRWIGRRLGEAKPGTVKRELNTLKAILNEAVRSGYLDRNPCAGASPIRGVAGRQRYLSHEEMIVILEAARTHSEWLYDFILWAIHSGMRKGEICALQWNNIHKLSDGRVIVQIQASKSDRPREVICTGTMQEVLDRQWERRSETNNALFPIAPKTLRRHWEKARDAAGLSDVWIHDLRRTHATHAAAAGVDLRTLAARLGHRDLAMLERHYAMAVNSAAQKAVVTIEGIFESIDLQPAEAARAQAAE